LYIGTPGTAAGSAKSKQRGCRAILVQLRRLMRLDYQLKKKIVLLVISVISLIKNT
jgi:hypothetical protein